MLKEISAKPSICLGVNLNVFQMLADDDDRSRFLLLYSKTSRLVFTARLRPQVRMPPVRNARRTSCPIPSAERGEIPNFRTRTIPNL